MRMVVLLILMDNTQISFISLTQHLLLIVETPSLIRSNALSAAAYVGTMVRTAERLPIRHNMFAFLNDKSSQR